MKNILPLFLISLFFVSSCGVTKNVKTKTIFRHINLGSYGQIKLGDKFTDFEHLVSKTNNSYYLKDGIFGGAESIEFMVNNYGNISEVIFEYHESIKKDTQITSYQEDLGTPSIRSGKAIWNDGKTQFEIYNQKVQNGNITFSKLVDLKK